MLADAVQAVFPGTQVTIGPVIENGFYYDFYREQPFTPEDFAAIEKKMREIVAADKPIVREEWTRDEAIAWFEKHGEAFKVELVHAIPADQKISVYQQGDWLDLCRGPHMPSTGKIGQAFKLMKVAGAYWRGDCQSRCCSASTPPRCEAGRPRSLSQAAGGGRAPRPSPPRARNGPVPFPGGRPGHGVLAPQGLDAVSGADSFMRRRQQKAGYIEVNTPQVLDRALWETSGHWQTIAKTCSSPSPRTKGLRAETDELPRHVQIFKNGLKSYRDLPMKIAEFGIVHRYEPSGAIHGVMRVRAFTQDDAHIFCTEDQIMEEALKINEMVMTIYKDFGFEDIVLKLSTRPEKRVGSDEFGTTPKPR